jgi:hypothetical protein
MSNSIVGIVEKIGPIQALQGRNGTMFSKRELVLDASRYDQFTGEKWENYPLFEFSGNRCSELENLNIGDKIEVFFILNGFKYEKDGQIQYFTKATGYRIEKRVRTSEQQVGYEKVNAVTASELPTQTSTSEGITPPWADVPESEGNGLPF